MDIAQLTFHTSVLMTTACCVSLLSAHCKVFRSSHKKYVKSISASRSMCSSRVASEYIVRVYVCASTACVCVRVCVCVCVCVYVYVCVHVYELCMCMVCTNVYTYVDVRTYVCVYDLCGWVWCMRTLVYVYVCVGGCKAMYAHVYLHVCGARCCRRQLTDRVTLTD